MWNQSSLGRWSGVDPRLREVLELTRQRTGIPFELSEGLRDRARQRKMVAQGKSQTEERGGCAGAMDGAVSNWSLDTLVGEALDPDHVPNLGGELLRAGNSHIDGAFTHPRFLGSVCREFLRATTVPIFGKSFPTIPRFPKLLPLGEVFRHLCRGKLRARTLRPRR